MTLSLYSSWRASTLSAARRDPRRGGAAVEFALVLPIFLLLVMGTVDYGYYFFSDQVMAGAAREGARAGSMVEPGSSAAAAVAAAHAYMSANGINCPGGVECVTPVNVTTYAVTGPTGNVLTMNKIQVTIRYAFTGLTGYSSVITPGFVNAYAEMAW